VKLPKVGTWVRVQWRDADTADRWADADNERPRTIEVTAGVYRGHTEDDKIRVAPTVSIYVGSKTLNASCSEIEIPLGCVTHIERQPTVVIK